MCDVRGVWLVESSTREVVFSRRFRTVERRARSLAAAAAAAAAARPSKGTTITTSATEPASSDSNGPPQPLPAAAAWRDLPPTDAEWIEAVLAELAGGGDTDADPVSNQSSKQASTNTCTALQAILWCRRDSLLCHVLMSTTVASIGQVQTRVAAHLGSFSYRITH